MVSAPAQGKSKIVPEAVRPHIEFVVQYKFHSGLDQSVCGGTRPVATPLWHTKAITACGCAALVILEDRSMALSYAGKSCPARDAIRSGGA